jgi:hypothetical protein
LAGFGLTGGYEAAKLELTYSTSYDIYRTRTAFGMLYVCIIQVL